MVSLRLEDDLVIFFTFYEFLRRGIGNQGERPRGNDRQTVPRCVRTFLWTVGRRGGLDLDRHNSIRSAVLGRRQHSRAAVPASPTVAGLRPSSEAID